jgi:hypothetical protein
MYLLRIEGAYKHLYYQTYLFVLNVGLFFFCLVGVFANLMPKRDYFSKALYTFDIGQNDLSEGFFSNMTIEEVNASVPDIVNKFSTNVKVNL